MTGIESDNGAGEEQNPLLKTGNYTLVSIDVDTTGKRLVDEIVQLAAYTEKDEYSQYIMPYMNMNPAARNRHQIRVVSIGYYRMLKDMTTYKVLKAKSEIAALKDFLEWIEKIKSSDPKSDGVILIYHEERKFVPYMILDSMQKYNLLDRFLATVKSFANGFELAKKKCSGSIKYFSLKQLSKILLNINSPTAEKAGFEGSAKVRAKLSYRIVQHLAKAEQEEITNEHELRDMFNLLHEFTKPIDIELNDLESEKLNITRQNSFRPVFLEYYKLTLYHRVKAVGYRILLSKYGYDLIAFEAGWKQDKKDGILKLVDAVKELEAPEKEELATLFDEYFDPTKVPKTPTLKKKKKKSKRRPRKSKSKKEPAAVIVSAGGGDGDNKMGPHVADSTVQTPVKKLSEKESASPNKKTPDNKQQNRRNRRTSSTKKTPNKAESIPSNNVVESTPSKDESNQETTNTPAETTSNDAVAATSN